mmetsp:Transcript_33619/g.49409  ORF Transcript_33619/g.49409 Transcript_33619/m.49409 type:complete len:230 (-) Transcript_33619:670-1359(-)
MTPGVPYVLMPPCMYKARCVTSIGSYVNLMPLIGDPLDKGRPVSCAMLEDDPPLGGCSLTDMPASGPGDSWNEFPMPASCTCGVEGLLMTTTFDFAGDAFRPDPAAAAVGIDMTVDEGPAVNGGKARPTPTTLAPGPVFMVPTPSTPYGPRLFGPISVYSESLIVAVRPRGDKPLTEVACRTFIRAGYVEPKGCPDSVLAPHPFWPPLGVVSSCLKLKPVGSTLDVNPP